MAHLSAAAGASATPVPSITFTVVSRGPRKPQDEADLDAQLAETSGDFLVHLGDVGTPYHSREVAAHYARVDEILRAHTPERYVLPGANEWLGPEAAKGAWKQQFLPSPAPPSKRHGRERAANNLANFAFSRQGVLFVGIHLPPGPPAERPGWHEELDAACQWAETQFMGAVGAQAAVVFTHAFPGRHHEAFIARFHEAARRLGVPVLLMHADSEYARLDRPFSPGPRHIQPDAKRLWIQDRPWAHIDITRVQTEPVGFSLPLRVTVKPGAQEPFELDRQYRRRPYLTLGTPHSMVIVWRTNRPIDPVVKFGRAPDHLDQTVADIVTKTATSADEALRLHSAPTGVYQYEAHISRLEPGTQYYYAIFDGTHVIEGGPEHHFRTSPKPGSQTPFRFWTHGDSGRGNQPQADVYQAMLRFTEADGRAPDLFLHLGDMAYSDGTDAEFQRNFFRPYEKTLRHTVLWPTMSNHEGHTSDGLVGIGPYYDAFVLPKNGEAGGVPSGTASYFGFDYANVHFVCLNTYDIDLTPDGDLARWLKADLAEADADWLIAYWHHPPYTKGSHDSDREQALIDVRTHIMPILEEGGIDLIFNGHSHIYERSMLIDGAHHTPTVADGVVLDDGDGDPQGEGPYRKSAGLHPNEGVVAVVAGCGGTGVRRDGTMPVMRRVVTANGSVLVDVAGDTLTATMVGADGQVHDRFQIVKRGRVQPRRVAQPRLLPPFVNFDRVRARIEVQSELSPGEPAVARLTVPPLPHDSAATVHWETGGTPWQVSPATRRIELSAAEPAIADFTLQFGDKPFPRPAVRIDYHTEHGDEPGALHFRLPPLRHLELKELAAPPTIDGRIDPAEIADLTPHGDLVRFHGDGYGQVPTTFYAGLFQDSLYVAFINDEPEMKRVRIANPKAPEAHFSDDTVEIFLQREGDPHYYLFVVNALGQTIDAKGGWRPEHRRWSGNWEAATQCETQRWTAEVAIDLGIAGAPLAQGDVLRLNVCRHHAVRCEYTQWSHTNLERHPDPFSFGRAIVLGATTQRRAVG